jgi:Kdo2-lipid IVA lauroyltransferase/acyltransferase
MVTAFRALGRLPLFLLHAIGALAGWLTYLASPRYRRRLTENLAAAIPGSGPMLGAAIAEAGKAVLELPAVWFRPAAGVAKMMAGVEGWACVEAALARGKGVVFLTPHLGCFEITAQYYALHHPITVLYRPPRKRFLEPLLIAGRERPELRLASADTSGVRLLLKALRRGEAVGMLPDQAPRFGEGAWADFFGRPAYTMTLAGRLAGATGAQVIMAHAERLPAGRGFRLHLAPGPQPGAGEAFEKRMNAELETLIRRNPAQYLWAYDRYKAPRGAGPAP